MYEKSFCFSPKNEPAIENSFLCWSIEFDERQKTPAHPLEQWC